MRQVDWAVEMVKRYLDEKKADSVGIRRLHYYIVSLPESERMMPAKRGFRTYENTSQDYKKLSELLTQARIEGLVPFKWIIDEKNLPIIMMPTRKKGTWYLDYEYNSSGYIPFLKTVEEMAEFDELVQSIDYKPIVEKPRFIHQTHHIVVAIEKATSRTKLERLCTKYGADLLIFTGQFSVTRVHDAVSRAMTEEKPVALLYISDLDCAGWFMPEAFFKRVNEIYPHPDNKVVRVALTREQVIKYNLPPAFDPDDKKYPETQKQRFIEESRGRECIELDALDEDVLIQLLEQELKKWAALEKDNEEHENLEKKAEEAREKALSNLDLSDLKDEYEEVMREFNEVVEEIRQLWESIKDKAMEVDSKRDDFYKKLRKRIVDAKYS